jgi:hypothetical protein
MTGVTRECTSAITFGAALAEILIVTVGHGSLLGLWDLGRQNGPYRLGASQGCVLLFNPGIERLELRGLQADSDERPLDR